MTDLTHSAMLPCKEAAWLSGNTPKKCCKETVEGGGIEEQNREEGEMAQKKLGGGRNRGELGRREKM